MTTFTTSSQPRRAFDRREFRQTYIDMRDPAQAAPSADVRPISHVPVLADVACYHLVVQATATRLAAHGASLPSSADSLLGHLERTCRIAGIDAMPLPAVFWERIATQFKVLQALAELED
ncbi:hypothetical protein LJR118_006665 [Acidovorax sp. LjRoot118]|uniref:hypothetical protein n=1 Tax=Acidovorax sp. LjRoot118 TaxID=3342256 RepID=UPI003ECE5B8A